MTFKNTWLTPDSLHIDLLRAKELLYDLCGFEFTEATAEPGSSEYGASSFRLNGLKIIHRTSKITPTKTGQFVTIWKRNENGITAPFDLSDNLDFIIITSVSEENLGQFIFPKAVLFSKGIVSGNNKDGKRGIRVYPPWNKPTSKQAEKTQHWQLQYFVNIQNGNADSLIRAKELFSNT